MDNSVNDMSQDKQIRKSDFVLMLPKNTSLMVKLSEKFLKSETELELGKLIHTNLKVEGKNGKLFKGKFLEVIIKGDLYLKRKARCSFDDCICEIPSLPEQIGESVSNTYTVISLAFEPGRRNPGGSVYNQVFFCDDGIWKSLNILRNKRSPSSVKLNVEDVKDFLLENQNILSEILKSNITKEDIIALAYRKEQIGVFETLLYSSSHFKSYKEKFNLRGDESVWQHFFEKNTWIFGYGLNYIFTSPIGDLRLEQVVQGHSFFQSGKRIDALLKTRGLISSLCFVEIKTHNTDLIEKDSYRSACYPISQNLAGAVSQIQKTVQKAITNIRTKLEMVTKEGDPVGDVAYLYQPRSFIVIGKLDEFQTVKGTNEEKFSSFELFRQNINNPEIITFDELYERAKFITGQTER